MDVDAVAPVGARDTLSNRTLAAFLGTVLRDSYRDPYAHQIDMIEMLALLVAVDSSVDLPQPAAGEAGPSSAAQPVQASPVFEPPTTFEAALQQLIAAGLVRAAPRENGGQHYSLSSKARGKRPFDPS